MRFKGQLLSDGESARVIAEIDAWCRRTGTNYNRLIVAAHVAPSLRSDVRYRGRRLTKMTAQKIHRTMRRFGAGISWEQHKSHLAQDRATLREDIGRKVREHIELRRVDRTPCPRCGVRADIGCEHSRRFERQPTMRIMSV